MTFSFLPVSATRAGDLLDLSYALFAQVDKALVVHYILRNVHQSIREEVIKMGKNQHVVPREGGWAVQGAGNDRATSVHDTQAGAIDRARDIARNQESELLIHGRNGQIRARDSYGGDPFPPKG